MTPTHFFIGALVGTIAWQLSEDHLGPPLTEWIEGKRSDASRGTESSRERSKNLGLLILASIIGVLAGVVGFPVVTFINSAELWDWIPPIAMMALSWGFAWLIYPALF